MADPFLYLEDLVKAAVPKPPANIGGGAKPPKAQKTLAQAATPKPPKNIGTGTIANAPKPPAAQKTIAGGTSTPPVSANAKAVASGVKWEYWRGGVHLFFGRVGIIKSQIAKPVVLFSQSEI